MLSKPSNKILLLVFAVLVSTDGLCLNAWVVQSFPMPRRANHRLSTALLREINELELPIGDRSSLKPSKGKPTLVYKKEKDVVSLPRVGLDDAREAPFPKVERLIEDLIESHNLPKYLGETRGGAGGAGGPSQSLALGGSSQSNGQSTEAHPPRHQSRSLPGGGQLMKPETRSLGYAPTSTSTNAAAAAATPPTDINGGPSVGVATRPLLASDCDWRTSIAIGTSGYRFPCTSRRLSAAEVGDGGAAALGAPNGRHLDQDRRLVSDEYLRISANFERMIDQLRSDARLLLGARQKSTGSNRRQQYDK